MVYNYIAADAVCTKCGTTAYFPEIQYKYGLCDGVKYLIGFKIEIEEPNWRTRNDPPIPPGTRVITDGYGRCPNCKQVIEFQIGMVDQIITDVTPISEQ